MGYAISKDAEMYCFGALCGAAVQLDAQDLLDRILDDMPDDVAERILEDLHKEYDYE